jgi:hypothetical protein
MNKEELLESLKCYISTIDETITISLINFIEDEGLEATDELLIYLWNGIKNIKGIKRASHLLKSVNGINTQIAKTFIVYK